VVNKKILISFLFFFLSFGLLSQTPINLKSKVDTLSIKIGEEIKYEFSFVADSLNDFEFKLLKFNPPIDVIQEFQIDTLFENNRVRFIKKYSLTSFEPGSFSITPPIKILDQIIKSQDSILISVSGIKVDTVSKKFFDIKNIIEVEKDYEGWWKKYFLILSIISILILSVKFYKESKYFNSSKEIITPPLEKAIKALKSLELNESNSQSDYKEYYSKLTEIVKGYFEEEVKVDALESTTNELILKLELLKDAGQLDISKETLKNFKSVLSTADLVKFAKSTPGSKTAILDKQLLETVLVDTKEAIPDPTEEELLQNEEYIKKIQVEKKRKLVINITKIFSIIIFSSLVASVSIFGWEEVKDYLFGNSTKELLQKEDWVVSSYGAIPIKISSPGVLTRNDSQPGQLFSFQSLENPFSITINTRLFNKEDDIQSILIEKLKTAGALNILIQQENFTLDNGIATTRYYGSFDYLNNEKISIKKEYSSLSFFENGGTQTLNIITDRDNKYAKQIRTKIESSIDFNKK
tara:strand:+ start:1431 stop:2999 length:1569 start_codon:yes stop_codon:yes gene_type:complete